MWFVNGVISNLLGVNVALQSSEEDVSLGEKFGTMYEDGCEDREAEIRAPGKAMIAAGRADEFLSTLVGDQELYGRFEEFGIEMET